MRTINSNELAFVVGGDAAATRPAGTNSWGEAPGQECTSKTVITIDENNNANNNEATCSLTTAPPFFKCDVVIYRTGGTKNASKKTVIECSDKRSTQVPNYLQKIQYLGT